MRTVMTALGGVIAGAGLLVGGYFLPHTHVVDTKVVTVTRTVPKTVYVTRWKTKTKTVTLASSATPSWYATVNDPEWVCIGGLMHQYIQAVSGGPWGDPSIFTALCPNVALPNAS